MPNLLACRRVQRKYIVVARCNEHHAVNHNRRHFHRHVRVAEHTGVESPRWFQLVDIGRIDLIEAHVA